MQKRNLMLEAMATLNAREKDIIHQRRLLEEPATLEELSARYGISRERVRQIEARALEKMTEFVLAAQREQPAALPAPKHAA